MVRRVLLSSSIAAKHAASAACSSITSKAIVKRNFAFVSELGDAFLDAYLPIAKRRPA
jgi:hypothetical protein